LEHSALQKLNSDHRWFRLRRADDDEIFVPSNLQRTGWAGYCACDGSGLYNGAFGPLRRKLTRRKSGRSHDSGTQVHELIIDGQEVTALELQRVLGAILSHSVEMVMTLRTAPITKDTIDRLLLTSPNLDIDRHLANNIELFTEFEQAFRLVRLQQSTNNPMDRSGGSAAS
jgi:hypothetical protein